MTKSSSGWSVELTRSATRDLRRLRGEAFEQAIRAINRLERDPLLGDTLSGNLSGARSLHFSIPGSGQFRAAYVCLNDNRTCLVFAIGPRENFYREAERRWSSLQSGDYLA